MVDVSTMVAAKSEQLTSDDLIDGPRVLTIAKASTGSAEQPLNLFFQGDKGKPYRPNKSMRRVLIAIWGKHAEEWIGKSIRVFRDPKVRFGDLETGGIKISHASDLPDNKAMTIGLQASKGIKRGHTVKPLEAQQQGQQTGTKAATLTPEQRVAEHTKAAETWAERIKAAATDDVLDGYASDDKLTKWRARLRDPKDLNLPDLAQKIEDAFGAAFKRFQETEAKAETEQLGPDDEGSQADSPADNAELEL